MKTSVYIALIFFFISGLGAAAILMLKDVSHDVLPAPTQASQTFPMNWGEGAEIKWDSNPANAKKTSARDIKLARN